MCPGLCVRSLIFALLGALATPVVAAAAFEVVSHGAIVDPDTRQTTFALTFNRPPDFFGVDAFGNPNHAFQYFYDTDPAGGEIGFDGPDVVILRGSEIRFDQTIPVRESLNPSGEEIPNAEGWGEKRGETQFTLDGETLTFTLDWQALGEEDGRFAYRLFALERGELTSELTSSPVLIALPPAVLGGFALIGVAFTCSRLKVIGR